MNTKAAPKRVTQPRHIPTTPVESSAIAAIGHDVKSKTLRVEFVSGGVYDYPDVSADAHQELVSAKSIGRHFIDTYRHRTKFTRHS